MTACPCRCCCRCCRQWIAIWKGSSGPCGQLEKRVGREHLRYHVVRSKAGAERASERSVAARGGIKECSVEPARTPARHAGAMRSYRTERYARSYSVQHTLPVDILHLRTTHDVECPTHLHAEHRMRKNCCSLAWPLQKWVSPGQRACTLTPRILIL